MVDHHPNAQERKTKKMDFKHSDIRLAWPTKNMVKDANPQPFDWSKISFKQATRHDMEGAVTIKFGRAVEI